MGRHAGLGVIPGRVVKFVSDLPPDPTSLRECFAIPAREGEDSLPLSW